MRRALVTVGLLAIAAGVVACSATGGGKDSGPYHVFAVFDNARGVLGGGLVKIAGADVGTVQRLSITAGDKALVELSIDRRFAPFREDATCEIRSSGLVGERYVECNPGSPATSSAQPGDRAFVSLGHTSVPVDLSDFFNIWTAPVRQRLSLLFNELGIATAGRGQDINGILRRANPALVRADQVLSILDRQRAQLADLVSETDTALKLVGARGPSVANLIQQASRTFGQIGSSSAALQTGITGLPPLLRRTRASVGQLDAFATASIPVLGDFQAAAPRLAQLVAAVPPFAQIALPAVTRLGPAITRTRKTLIDSGRVVGQLHSFSQFALPAGQLLDQLLVSARQAGAFDYLSEFNYFLASATSRYDAFTHIVPAALLTFSNCGGYATTPAGGECQATYTTPPSQAEGTSKPSARRHGRRPARVALLAGSASGQAAAAPGSPSGATTTGNTVGGSALPGQPAQAGSSGTQPGLQPLVNYLLH